jgi:hypothetical protein
MCWACRRTPGCCSGWSWPSWRHSFWANQLRLLLAALAYTLMINSRRHALAGTELAQACTATIRVQLLKIAAAIMRNTRRVRVMLASSRPMRSVFASAAQALAP